MAVGIAAVAVETAVGPIQALDDPGALEGFEVLVDGGMTDVAALGVEPLKDVAGAQVIPLIPEQLKDHAPLAREPHPQVFAARIGEIHPVGLAIRCGVGCRVSSHDPDRSLTPL